MNFLFIFFIIPCTTYFSACAPHYADNALQLHKVIEEASQIIFWLASFCSNITMRVAKKVDSELEPSEVGAKLNFEVFSFAVGNYNRREDY